MKKIAKSAMDILRGRRGAATTEYALLLTLVVIVLIGAMTQLGAALQSKIMDIVAQLNAY